MVETRITEKRFFVTLGFGGYLVTIVDDLKVIYLQIGLILKQTTFHMYITEIYLGIEFYLFVSHGDMNGRGSMCKFRNARSAFRNSHVKPLSFIPQ